MSVDPSIMALLQGGGAPGGQGGPPPAGYGDPMTPPMGAPPMGGAPSTPQEEAVWAQFPSTDPNVLMQLLGPLMQGGSPTGLAQALQALPEMQQHDRDLLDEMQRQQVQNIVAQLMAPAPGMQLPTPGANPEVGGDSSGY